MFELAAGGSPYTGDEPFPETLEAQAMATVSAILLRGRCGADDLDVLEGVVANHAADDGTRKLAAHVLSWLGGSPGLSGAFQSLQ